MQSFQKYKIMINDGIESKYKGIVMSVASTFHDQKIRYSTFPLFMQTLISKGHEYIWRVSKWDKFSFWEIMTPFEVGLMYTAR